MSNMPIWLVPEDDRAFPTGALWRQCVCNWQNILQQCVDTHPHTHIYIYIKAKGIYQPENLMSNGSSRHDMTCLTLIDTEEGHLLIENFVNIFFVTPLSVSLHNLLDFYIYIYVWKLNQIVLELDFRAVKFFSSLDGIWTHTIDTLQHHSFSLTSSALDHSTTSTP